MKVGCWLGVVVFYTCDSIGRQWLGSMVHIGVCRALSGGVIFHYAPRPAPLLSWVQSLHWEGHFPPWEVRNVCLHAEI